MLFFDERELDALGDFVRLILPGEEYSPSATDLGVPKFLDDFVARSSEEEGEIWRRGLRRLRERAEADFGGGMSSLDAASAHAFLTSLFDGSGPDPALAEFARRAKAAAIKAYYRTEHGLHQELRVPRRARAEAGPHHDFAPAENLRECYDAIVVGSGATGSWAAKELTEAGLEVLVLDAGGLPPSGPMPKQPYQLPYRNMFDNAALNGGRRPVQSRSWACDEYRGGFFIDDVDNPYGGSKDFTWIRPAYVGGRMNMWGRQVYRYAPQDLSAEHLEQQAPPWPFSYDDLAPFYDEVEDYIGVSGSADGLANLPDGKFLPPMEMTDGERHLKRTVETRWPDRKVIIGRTATLTRDHRGRKACDQTGHCYRGCPTNSFFEPLSSTLTAAQRTGRLHLRPQAQVVRIEMDEERGEAREIEFVDTRDGVIRKVKAKAFVLAASTIASTRILLASRSAARPNGIGGSSGCLGRFLHGHVHSVMCSGVVPWLLKPVGQHDEGRPNQIYLPQFVNNAGQRREGGFVGGFGIEGAVKHYMFPRDLGSRGGFGVGLKQSIRSELQPAHFFLTAFGVMLPRADNTVSLSNEADRWNIPTVSVSCSYGENDLSMAQAMAAAVVEIAEAAQFKVAGLSTSPGSPGLCVHEVGTARMGADRHTSVLDPFNRVWDAPNVLVVDGASFPSSGPQNPTLTMMAVALRASRRLARDLKSNRPPNEWKLTN